MLWHFLDVLNVFSETCSDDSQTINMGGWIHFLHLSLQYIAKALVQLHTLAPNKRITDNDDVVVRNLVQIVSRPVRHANAGRCVLPEASADQEAEVDQGRDEQDATGDQGYGTLQTLLTTHPDNSYGNKPQ